MYKNEELSASIEGIYAAFSSYPLPAYTDPCLHCHSAEDEAKLRSKPLRELGIDELRAYSNDALLVWGDERIFKHFLPRIYDLYFTIDEPILNLTDPEIILSKFRYGYWRRWPVEEQAAVVLFFRALWAAVLNDPPEKGSFTDLESWLCAIGQAEDNLAPYLDQWIANYSQNACLALSSFLLTSAVALPSIRGRNAFWDGRDAQYAQLQRWVKGSAVIEKLRWARAKWTASGLEDEFSAALAILDD